MSFPIRKIGKKEISLVIKDGQFKRSNYLNLKFIPFIGPTRFFFVVSKKVSKLAVERNLIKRRSRAIINLNKDYLKPGFICVMMFKPEVRSLSFDQLTEEVKSALLAVGVLNNHRA